ncbi:TPA: hypothetical protein DEF17_06235 [bacterium]|nr:MAG: hypothetical protein COS94_06065 [Candidatus Hydrogenedentes bacterium CG07_land_8_20_14_0_80_42_17]HBW47515.1 hypothetical protein [bacterium]
MQFKLFEGEESSSSAIIVVTIATFAGQALGFLTSVISAALFGAGSDMDAFMAVNALPQYIVSVFLGSIGFVFIPVFVDTLEKKGTAKASELASTIFNIVLLIFILMTAASLILSKRILELLVPGLDAVSFKTAHSIALILWPTITACGIITMLTYLSQSLKKFVWQALTPVIGGIMYLILLIAFGVRFGIKGMAYAATISVFLQAVLLLPLLKNIWKFKITLFNPELHKIFKMLWPLFFSNLFIQLIPLIDRYLASYMAEGSISHLGYAMKLLTLFSIVISGSVSTVLFPRMAAENSRSDIKGFVQTISKGLRFIWLFTAPAILIGIALSNQLVEIVFQRGAFTLENSGAVAGVLRIYLIALGGMTLAEITARALYVMGKTRFIAVLKVFQALFYICVARVFSARWGIYGIASAFVLLNYLSFGLQIFVVKFHFDESELKRIFKSFSLDVLSALLASSIAYIFAYSFSSLAGFTIGALTGVFVYFAFLFLIRSADIYELIDRIGEIIEARRALKQK